MKYSVDYRDFLDVPSAFTLTCDSDFIVAGLQRGEDLITVVRIAATIVTLTVTSAWTWKKIGRLRLFFAHWLA